MNCNLKKHLCSFIEQYREQLLYLFFGILTTIVNYVTFALLRKCWGDFWIHLINLTTFIIATLFAFITNKIFVFKSQNWKIKHTLVELSSFFVSRISSFILEAAGLYFCVNILNVGKYTLVFLDGTMAAKIILSFVAVIVNYFFSKFFVFRKKKEGNKA